MERLRVLLAFLVVFVLACFTSVTEGLDNGLGQKPQMGWNSWNQFGCKIDETLIRESIDALVSTGLAKAGYRYMNIDDCWAGWRDSSGFIHPDNKTFPNGIRILADYAHSKGLLFGIYSDAGTETCAGRPGSLGFEQNDADTYAAWTVDYLKYDNCNNMGISPLKRYPLMRDALNATKRKIFYSLCEWGEADPATWAPEVGNSWRTTGDISANWGSVMEKIDQNDKWWKYAGPGGWNDPDMLEVGVGDQLNLTEQKTHFSLWALAKAPLLIGCDIRKLAPEVLEILTAPEVIAINQDPLGVQGHKVWNASFSDAAIDVWAGLLSNKDIAVITLNRASVPATIPVRWEELGLQPGTKCLVRDIWQRKDIGTHRNGFTTSNEPHGVSFLRLSCA